MAGKMAYQAVLSCVVEWRKALVEERRRVGMQKVGGASFNFIRPLFPYVNL
jgi:hypothetical protein